jgi:hypothetical protein
MTDIPNKSENGNNATRAGTRKRSAAHPRTTLQEAEDFARIVFDMGVTGCDPDNVAKKYGYSAAKNGSFNLLRATAKQFGLIDSDARTISVSQKWIPVFHHDDEPRQLQEARQHAMRQPDLYKMLIEEYSGRQLPPIEKLARELHIHQKYGILKDAADVAARVFYESASFAGLIDEKNYFRLPADTDMSLTFNDTEGQSTDETVAPGVETFSNPATVQNPKNKSTESHSSPPTNTEGLFRYEIPLENDSVVYLYAPRRLPHSEKERLKKFIDLMLEESPVSPRSNNMQGNSDSRQQDPNVDTEEE